MSSLQVSATHGRQQVLNGRVQQFEAGVVRSQLKAEKAVWQSQGRLLLVVYMLSVTSSDVQTLDIQPPPNKLQEIDHDVLLSYAAKLQDAVGLRETAMPALQFWGQDTKLRSAVTINDI